MIELKWYRGGGFGSRSRTRAAFPHAPAARVGPVTALHRMGKKLRLKKYRAARFFAGSNFCDFSSDPQT